MGKAERDIRLLRESIERKWLPILLGLKDDEGFEDCPLCEEYYWESEECVGCPIGNYCDGTPYDEWLSGKGTERREELARKEIYFLMGLVFKIRRGG